MGAPAEKAKIGDRFGRLVVVEAPKSDGKYFRAAVRCDCGTEKQ